MAKLIATNTPENLRKVERILGELGPNVGTYVNSNTGGHNLAPSFQSTLDYRGNINVQKSSMQQDAFRSWNSKRRNNSKSVQAKDAY